MLVCSTGWGKQEMCFQHLAKVPAVMLRVNALAPAATACSPSSSTSIPSSSTSILAPNQEAASPTFTSQLQMSIAECSKHALAMKKVCAGRNVHQQ